MEWVKPRAMCSPRWKIHKHTNTNTKIYNYTLGEKSRYLLTLSNTYLLTYFSTYGNVDPNALLDICFDCRSSLDTSIHTIQSEPPTEVDKWIFASHLLKLFEDMIVNTRTHKDTKTQGHKWIFVAHLLGLKSEAVTVKPCLHNTRRTPLSL